MRVRVLCVVFTILLGDFPGTFLGNPIGTRVGISPFGQATTAYGQTSSKAADEDTVSTDTAGNEPAREDSAKKQLEVIVLGNAQDAGYPQAGCDRECCKLARSNPSARRFATSLAIVDHANSKRYLFECTPDFREQLYLLDQLAPIDSGRAKLDGIFLTHAHIGHYAGLIHLGREVMSTDRLPVFCMPRMKAFLSSNGPWNQLVDLEQIQLKKLAAGQILSLGTSCSVVPFLVPHRDEYSETVGFEIALNECTMMFLPDIDKWEKWEVPIESLIARCDMALLDGTFFDGSELPGRDMSQIPHPFITESLSRFKKLPVGERRKIHFIHFNHTNPVLRAESDANRQILELQMHVAEQGQRFRF